VIKETTIIRETKLVKLVIPALLVILGFSACSSDDSQLQEQSLSVDVMLSAPAFTDAEASSDEGDKTTRSWTPPTTPTRYYLYDDLYTDDDGNWSDYANYVSQDMSLSNKTIDAFFTHTGEEGLNTEPNPLHCRLKYIPGATPATSKWRLVLPNGIQEDAVKTGSYYVYGFIPRDAADNALISPNPTYDKGAVLTIEGMQAVSTDVCVIIGAKEGFSENYDGNYTDTNDNETYDDGVDTRTNRLTAGDFKYALKAGYKSLEPKEPYPNYMYLLFDHLCSALKIKMRVYKDYDDVRTIKLKELRLKTATDEGTTKKKMNVVVTLAKTNDGSNPIQSVTYIPTGTEECDGAVYQSEVGATLTTSYSMFLCHFIPHGIKKIILTSTYDVYDKKDNLIRANCKATNTIDVTKIIYLLSSVRRGYKYTINLTVKPTYLYMLSEPDMDNPTMVVE